MTRKSFEQIDYSAFQHPLDKVAIKSLEKVPGIDWFIRKFLLMFGEKRLRLFFLASSIKVSETQLGHVHQLLLDVCKTLDVSDIPEMFVSQNPMVNAAAIGVDKPFIVLNSSLVSMMNEDELRCVIAHEVGHIMCGHALYTTTLILLLRLWHMFIGIPGGIVALIAIRTALMEWQRKAELSADRAGLLVTQDLDVAIRVDLKLAGGKEAESVDTQTFLQQAEEYSKQGDVIDGVLKLSLLMDASHPFATLRVAELKKWHDEGSYQSILSGEYPKRGTKTEETFVERIKATLEDYRQQVNDSDDALIGAIKDLGGGVKSVGKDLASLLQGALGNVRGSGGSQSNADASDEEESGQKES